jgi:bla regulator protein blaR1
MTPITWDAWSSWIAGRLIAGSLEGAVVVSMVWLICRRFPAIPASVRAHAWWTVSLGLLLSLSALPSLPLPLLPAPLPLAAVKSTGDVAGRLALGSNETPSLPPHARSDEERRPASAESSGRTWLSVAMALWMAGVMVHAYRLAAAYASLRRAVRRSAPLRDDDGVHADRAAVAIGLTSAPRIHLSHEIEAPLVTGIVRPIVLIPAAAIDGFSPRERTMVIAHELAHVRRLDLLLAWVPAIAERLFFFHPLARLAAREYAAARESACDALVLHAMDVAPQEYGRMLVRLGVGVNPVFTVGGSSPSLASLKRRLDMLNDATSARSSRAAIALVAIVAMLSVLPLRVVARTPAAAQAAAVPATAQTPAARPVQTAKPQPAASAASASPAQAAPRAARPVTPQNENIEQAIAEQRRNLQRVEEALARLASDLQAMYARQHESQLEQEQQQLRRVYERSQSAQRRQESAARTNVQTTTQFLESELNALTAEHEETSARLRRLSAEIDSIRQKIDEARRAQEIESNEKKVDDKK